MAMLIPELTNLKAFALGYFLLGGGLLLIYLVRGGLYLGHTLIPCKFYPVRQTFHPSFCRGISLLPIAVVILWSVSFRSVLTILLQMKFILMIWLMASILFFISGYLKQEQLSKIAAVLILATQGFFLGGIFGSFGVVEGTLVFSYATIAPWGWMFLWPCTMISAAALNFNLPKSTYWLPLSLILLGLSSLFALRGLAYTAWPFIWWGLMFAHVVLAITKRRFYPRKEIYLSLSLFLLGMVSLSFPQVLWPHGPWRSWWEDLTWPRNWMVEWTVVFVLLGGLSWYWYRQEKNLAQGK
ncbi:MAG: hypothetical protein J6Y94_00675 [Bacteriovoracaceae bacterium]|nr:hypothetical protein [Bacteriovoracaceae bacterium]